MEPREPSEDISLDLPDNEDSDIKAAKNQAGEAEAKAAEVVEEPAGAGVKEDLRGMEAAEPKVIVLSHSYEEVAADPEHMLDEQEEDPEEDLEEDLEEETLANSTPPCSDDT